MDGILEGVEDVAADGDTGEVADGVVDGVVDGNTGAVADGVAPVASTAPTGRLVKESKESNNARKA